MHDVNPIALVVGAVVGGFMGYRCGKIPYNAAVKRGRENQGQLALMTCCVVGVVGGCLLALPTALVWTLVISAMGESTPGESLDERAYRRSRRGGGADPLGRALQEPSSRRNGRFTAIGPVILCNRCRQATSKDANGNPPARCPSCGEKFVPTVKKAQRRGEEDDVVPLEVAPPPRR